MRKRGGIGGVENERERGITEWSRVVETAVKQDR